MKKGFVLFFILTTVVLLKARDSFSFKGWGMGFSFTYWDSQFNGKRNNANAFALYGIKKPSESLSLRFGIDFASSSSPSDPAIEGGSSLLIANFFGGAYYCFYDLTIRRWSPYTGASIGYGYLTYGAQRDKTTTFRLTPELGAIFNLKHGSYFYVSVQDRIEFSSDSLKGFAYQIGVEWEVNVEQ